jgi:glyoxylase-like metal-dependent hydrolase (beta-lactamase superfamily II)
MLERLGERVWAVPGGVNGGVIRGESGRAILIDPGLNETSGKKAIKAAAEAVGEVGAIVTTHGHADHFGANAAVVKRTGAEVWAPVVDEAVLRYPILQPALLFGGADPIDTMRGSFMLADASPVDHVFAPGQPLVVDGVAFDVIDLSGHSPGQTGLVIDGIFFSADVTLPAAVLEKYRIPYLFGVTTHLAALDRARAIPCRRVVPGHGPLMDDIGPTVDLNRALLDQVMERTVELAREPATAEAILTGLLRSFGSPAADASGFYLLQPTSFAVLAHLHREGAVSHVIEHGQSVWSAV